MAQPAQGNPFGAPAAAGPYGTTNMQQPSGNPFGPVSGKPPVSIHSDPFSTAANAGISGPAQQPQHNAYAAPPAQQQGFAPQPQISTQQFLMQSLPQQGFEPQPANQPPQQQELTFQPQFSAQQQPPQTIPQPHQPPPQMQTQPEFSPHPEQPPYQQAFIPQFSVQQHPPQTTPQPQQQYGGYPTAGVVEQQAVNPFSNALVTSQQPANPYSGYAPPVQQPVNPFGSEAMVPVTHQQSQWAVPGAVAAGAVAAANPFDPFAPPPPPAPAPVPPPQPPSIVSHELVHSTAPQGYQAPDFPFDADNLIVPVPAQNGHPPPDTQGPPVNEVSTFHGGHSVVSEPETTLTRRSEDRDREVVPYEARRQTSPQNKYSQILAQNAPPGSSPLPKGEMVMKSGYILARISFRTILIKKWKQTYWVQYGRHTMLWFRSENHFNEWLSNPYLSQAQRNFLVKLAINFVHDLYKPNVRGYQVTQAHTKAYGGKLIRQFKLERWMDYGPTIAAAFGSPDQNEVDELRQTIIDCMKNTPLENGIRATGAVRHGQEDHYRNSHNDHRFSYDDHPPRLASELTSARLDGDENNRARVPAESRSSAPTGGRSVVSMNDLLDDYHGHSDTASFGGYSTGNYANYSQAPAQHTNQQYAGYR